MDRKESLRNMQIGLLDGKEKNVAKQETPSQSDPPNGGYGWVVVGASFMCSAIVQGTSFSFGILLVSLVEYYRASSGELAWIGSLFTGMMSLTGPFSSAMMTKFGSRSTIMAGSLITTIALLLSTEAPSIGILKLTFGFMGGIGLGLIQLPAYMCVPSYFTTKRGTAVGISMCGSSMGALLLPALIYYVLEVYDWKGALYIVSGLTLNCMVFASLIKPLKSSSSTNVSPVQRTSSLPVKQDSAPINIEKTENYDNLMQEKLQTEKKLQKPNLKNYFISEKCIESLKKLLCEIRDVLGISLLKEKLFLVLCVANVFIMLGLFAPPVFLPHSSILKGIERNKVALLLPSFGAANFIGRLTFGYISDKIKTRAITINYICLFMGGISCMMLPFCYDFTTTVIGITSCSFSLAGFISLTPILLMDMVGVKELPKAFGLICLFRGFATIHGTPLAGYVYDMTGSYDVPFYIAGSLLLGGGALTAVVSYMDKHPFKEKVAVSSP